jgi:hypothetical protein
MFEHVNLIGTPWELIIKSLKHISWACMAVYICSRAYIKIAAWNDKQSALNSPDSRPEDEEAALLAIEEVRELTKKED